MSLPLLKGYRRLPLLSRGIRWACLPKFSAEHLGNLNKTAAEDSYVHVKPSIVD